MDEHKCTKADLIAADNDKRVPADPKSLECLSAKRAVNGIQILPQYIWIKDPASIREPDLSDML